MSAIIQIDNVSVKLGKRVQALDSVSVEIPEGMVVGFIGPSGAGKTTLIRSIVGRQRLGVGSITVLGQQAGSAQLRSQLNYMTQEPSVYADLTVTQNLSYFATMSGVRRGDRKTQVAHILQTLDLTSQAKQLVSSLSGGQKQRVSLAIALIGSPRIMVLDEPTVGLDPLLRQQIWQLFHQLAKSGTTIIISSHVMDEAERCDQLVLLRDGQVLAHASPKELCQQTGAKNVEQSFLKLVEGS